MKPHCPPHALPCRFWRIEQMMTSWGLPRWLWKWHRRRQELRKDRPRWSYAYHSWSKHVSDPNISVIALDKTFNIQLHSRVTGSRVSHEKSDLLLRTAFLILNLFLAELSRINRSRHFLAILKLAALCIGLHFATLPSIYGLTTSLVSQLHSIILRKDQT